MTEAEWLACRELGLMLPVVDSPSSFRKLVLFACASGRHAWESLDETAQETIEVAESHEEHFWTGAEAGMVLIDLIDSVDRSTLADHPRFADILRDIFGN